MQIELRNIQAITEFTYDIDEVGITQIIGENSNGKSILTKAVVFVANTLIKHKDDRKAMIKRGSSFGSIKMIRHGVTLLVNISIERENCFYRLTRKDGTTINRTIREGGLEEIADEFGWTSYDGDVSLQIFETFGVMPFVNNNPASDYAIFDSIITDKVANDFVLNYENTTFPTFKSVIGSLNNQIESTQKLIDGITFYNISAYELVLKELRKYARIIPYITTIEVFEIPVLSKHVYMAIDAINVREIPIFNTPYDTPEVIDMATFIEEYNTALSGTCPMCGTSYTEMECSHAS